MSTPKEIFLELLRPDGQPERQLRQYEALSMCFTDPINAYLRGNRKRGSTSVDRWGTTISWPADAPGAMPVTENGMAVCPDVTRWREVVHAPDLGTNCAEGWDACRAAARAACGEEHLLAGFMGTGIFEQCHFLMGFENALTSLYEHPREMHELIDYILSYRLEYVRMLIKGLAHRCEDACKRGAISFDDNHVAHIDKTKCVECGACAKVCPYSAIHNYKRPCEVACKVKAISMGENKEAKINDDKCIACGACVYQCPFGAISDKSMIVDAIDILKKSNNNEKYKVYAVVAPSISSQFNYAKLGQVITALKKLGFYTVVEAALGADMVAHTESLELVEKGFLTSSCCPAFVTYIKNEFPNLVQHISHNLSPMATIAKYLKENDPTCKVIFIGPCTAKKKEIQQEEVKKYVDNVLTFEELQALFDSREFDITTFEEDILDNASYYGRIFARSGGLSDAVKEALKENNITDFDLKAVTCDGIEQCKIALLKKNKNLLDGNFIEGMACLGGCIGGAGCLTHGEKNKAEVDKYGMEAYEKTISDAISIVKMTK